MPPKRQVVAANERKAAQEDAKSAKAAAAKEQMDSAEWSKGAKLNKKEDEEKKKAEAAAKKAEREAMLAAEEAEFSKKKPIAAAKGGKKVESSAPKLTMAALNFSGSDAAANGTLDAYAASGLDDALELLDLATKGTSGGSNAAQGVEKHPERRMKSAWAAFEERELPIMKAENPSLRLSQLKQLLQKKWKKSPENPMNQENIGSYNMSAEEARDMVAEKREDAMEKMRVK